MKMLTKKGLAFIIIVLFLGLAITPGITSKSIQMKKTEMKIKDEREQSFLSLEASSFYEYGLKTGKRFNRLFRLTDILERVIKKNEVDENCVEDQIESMEKYSPYFLEELEGLSASTNIKLKRLIHLQSFIQSIFNKYATSTV